MSNGNNSYHSLLKKISRILGETKKDFKQGSNRFVLTSNWEIGKWITEIEDGRRLRPSSQRPERRVKRGGGEKTSNYRERVIERLSKDLNRKYGKGFSERNLQYARMLYKNYKLSGMRYELSWSHYKILLHVKDEKDRQTLEKKAISGDWAWRQLKEYIRANRIGGEVGTGLKIGLLHRPEGVFNHYRMYENFSKNPASRMRNVDLGFNVVTEILLSNSAIKLKNGTIVKSVKKENGIELKKAEVSERELFLYKAFPERVVDGDTILVRIDLGFNNYLRQRLRLRGVNSPERGAKGGDKVTKWLSKKLNQLEFVVIKTHEKDIYGRYLADVFYSEKLKEKEKVLREGIFLNNELLESGIAVVE